MISLLVSMMLVQTDKVCIEYEEVEITECQNTHVKNGVAGGLLGAVGGYLLGGKDLALLGGLAGGGIGAATGEKTCVKHTEKNCVKWKSKVLHKDRSFEENT